jgi:hypothetical protein
LENITQHKTDGRSPGKGFCCTVKHVARLASAIAAAAKKAEELGVMPAAAAPQA